jgi:hypothetical protein
MERLKIATNDILPDYYVLKTGRARLFVIFGDVLWKYINLF